MDIWQCKEKLAIFWGPQKSAERLHTLTIASDLFWKHVQFILHNRKIVRAARYATDEVSAAMLGGKQPSDTLSGSQKGPGWDYNTRGGEIKWKLYLQFILVAMYQGMPKPVNHKLKIASQGSDENPAAC